MTDRNLSREGEMLAVLIDVHEIIKCSKMSSDDKVRQANLKIARFLYPAVYEKAKIPIDTK